MATDVLLYIKDLENKVSIFIETFAILTPARKTGRKHSLGNADQMFCQNHCAAVTMTKEYEKKQLSNVTVSILVTA